MGTITKEISIIKSSIKSIELTLEVVLDKFDILVNVITGMNERITRVEKSVEPIPRIESDIRAIKTILKIHDNGIENHEIRIASLENATS